MPRSHWDGCRGLARPWPPGPRGLVRAPKGRKGLKRASLGDPFWVVVRVKNVHGIVKRNSISVNQTARIQHIFPQIRDNLYYGDLLDFSSLMRAIEASKPDEIYNLAAQSHVRISFDEPIYTVNSIANGTLNLLECVRISNPAIKFYQASSSEMFGNSVDSDGYQRESTPMVPVSPYACAKLCAFNLVRCYRESYNIFASNGILFNQFQIKIQ